MASARDKHLELTAARGRAFEDLFGDKSVSVHFYHEFGADTDERFFIDVFLYSIDTWIGPVVVAVTNGMSDYRMVDDQRWSRREILQYFRECTKDHASRLQSMAWLPLFDGFFLDSHHSVAWPFPAVEGTPWNNAFFLEPLIRSHREFRFEVDGMKRHFYGTYRFRTRNVHSRTSMAQTLSSKRWMRLKCRGSSTSRTDRCSWSSCIFL
jgi:hypothetical protein